MKQLFITLIALFLIVGCGPSDLEKIQEITSDAHHKGKITKIDDRVLVQELIANYYPTPVVVSLLVSNKTEILDANDNKIDFSELRKGQLVEVWVDGWRESDPLKAGALKIKLIQ
ncbi:DUF3221 domain-containing protein [Anaerobacillus alkaliphilus]|uniref:DUF3221 domain-containing protein n=1 Tax=Anaerobacillus alkaliphilus TaxID=1548597 RepID=A0A4Q0VY54_9BACI|nr:DUF3221 domain-containing protein [Anaerobacillus alkaliphilus]RXJ04410.1 DUF3221 domain-containing protein [Anaerobacillus alkaliphilus]